MNVNITVDDVLLALGQKEAENLVLRRQVAALQQALKEAAAVKAQTETPPVPPAPHED